jgi:hypothetical protein
MKHFIVALTLGILLISYPATVLPRDIDKASNPKLRRFSLSVYRADSVIGPAKDIEKVMETFGFNESSFGLFGEGVISYPYSRTTGFPWMIGLHYLFKSPFGVGVIVSNSAIGRTSGLKDPWLYVSLKYSVMTYASVVSIQAKAIRIGIGPALHLAHTHQENGDNKIESRSAKKFGFLLDLSLFFPWKSRFFGEIRAQYRSVGKVKIGPYETSSISLGYSAVLPATEVNYNHWLIGLGLGIRF